MKKLLILLLFLIPLSLTAQEINASQENTLPSKLSVQHGKVYGDGVQLSQSALLSALGQKEYNALNAGYRFKKAGRACLWAGVGVTVAGLGLTALVAAQAKDTQTTASQRNNMATLTGSIVGLGVTSMLASIPFFAVGSGKIKAVVNNYNNNHPATLSFGATNHGVGLALNF